MQEISNCAHYRPLTDGNRQKIISLFYFAVISFFRYTPIGFNAFSAITTLLCTVSALVPG